MRQAPPSVRLLAPLLALQLLAACQGAAPGDAPPEEVGEAALALTAPVAGPELRLPRGAPAPSGPQAGPLLAHGPAGYLALFRSDLLLSAVRIGDDGRLRDGVARAVLWEEIDSPTLTAGDEGFLLTWLGPQGHRFAMLLDEEGAPASERLLLGPAEGVGTVAVTFDGGAYLVVWDRFAGLGYDLYGARVSPRGAVERLPRPLATAIPDAFHLASAFDGTNHVVVFSEGTIGVRAIRVRPSGERLDPALPLGLALVPPADDPSFNYQFALSTDGTQTLVAWRDATAVPTRLRGLRLTPAGRPRDARPLDLHTFAGSADVMGLWTLFDGARFQLLWTVSSEGLFAARVSRGGQVLSQGALIETMSFFPELAAASNGAGALLLWSLDGGERLRYSRLSRGGRLLDGAGGTGDWGVALDTATEPCQLAPAAAAGPGGYLVAWQEGPFDVAGEIRAARLGAEGRLLDSPARSVSGGEAGRRPRLAASASQYLVAWEVGAEIHAARVAADGTVRDQPPLRLPIYAGEKGGRTIEALTAAGADFLLLRRRYWCFPRGPCFSEHRRTRITAAGALMDEAPITPPGVILAALARGSEDLLLGRDGAKLYSQRLTGGVLSPALELAPLDVLLPAALGGGGGAALAAWVGGEGEARALRASVLDAAGGLREPGGAPVSGDRGAPGAPAIAFDGRRYLLLWPEVRGGRFPELRGASLDPAGRRLVAGRALLARPLVGEGAAALAAQEPGRYLAAYQRLGRGGVEVRARLVRAPSPPR